jgi:hypothetical protein
MSLFVACRSTGRVRAASCALVCAAILASVPAAVASSARPGALYSGTGIDALNNAPKWVTYPLLRERISFRTSSDGRNVRDFRGAFNCYCNCSAGFHITAAFMRVDGHGRFAYHFSVPVKHGRDYVSISGGFLTGGRAKVSYLWDFVGTNQHIATPYSTSNPTALGCASWVRGTVSAR